ncbi:hypothetical protein GCM10007112_12880 [Vulcanisaeta souniana JCM 11219]|uniref:Uncharacterized protein n=1 Tax=Vulcanisaeta souniana JCM 11219 TaxID=1293586 RepID=A0A830E6U4_9CREN|nr:hypothetical protein GCM10007112_12880 [Vulcanisaeta souniana JCM 11219]
MKLNLVTITKTMTYIQCVELNVSSELNSIFMNTIDRSRNMTLVVALVKTLSHSLMSIRY